MQYVSENGLNTLCCNEDLPFFSFFFPVKFMTLDSYYSMSDILLFSFKSKEFFPPLLSFGLAVACLSHVGSLNSS